MQLLTLGHYEISAPNLPGSLSALHEDVGSCRLKMVALVSLLGFSLSGASSWAGIPRCLIAWLPSSGRSWVGQYSGVIYLGF